MEDRLEPSHAWPGVIGHTKASVESMEKHGRTKASLPGVGLFNSHGRTKARVVRELNELCLVR
jgi:hypothetical protein